MNNVGPFRTDSGIIASVCRAMVGRKDHGRVCFIQDCGVLLKFKSGKIEHTI